MPRTAACAPPQGPAMGGGGWRAEHYKQLMPKQAKCIFHAAGWQVPVGQHTRSSQAPPPVPVACLHQRQARLAVQVLAVLEQTGVVLGA